jgi:hypothetical protein
MLPKIMLFIWPIVTIDEAESIVIHGEVPERVFVRDVDQFLPVLQDNLDRDVKVFGENVVASQLLQAKVTSLEILRHSQQSRDGFYELRNERSAFFGSNEIRLQRGKGGRISVDLIHPRKGSDVLLHFVKRVIHRVKPNDPRPYASVSTVDESVPRDVTHPSEPFCQSALSVRHYSPVFVQNVEQDKVVDYGLRFPPIFSPHFPFNHCDKGFDLLDCCFREKETKVVSIDEDRFEPTLLCDAFVVGRDEFRKVRAVRYVRNPQPFGNVKHV